MFVVFEKGEKLHHILMAERFVQLDLVGQLFFGFVLDELALGNDFASESLPTTLFVTCLCTLKLITLGKSPLPLSVNQSLPKAPERKQPTSLCCI
eukprot:m.135785 g.135785  ORF g.135785 m.135785 type:complete len:95 (-) comp14877_c0_seq2:298-582(-)